MALLKITLTTVNILFIGFNSPQFLLLDKRSCHPGKNRDYWKIFLYFLGFCSLMEAGWWPSLMDPNQWCRGIRLYRVIHCNPIPPDFIFADFFRADQLLSQSSVLQWFDFEHKFCSILWIVFFSFLGTVCLTLQMNSHDGITRLLLNNSNSHFWNDFCRISRWESNFPILFIGEGLNLFIFALGSKRGWVGG